MKTKKLYYFFSILFILVVYQNTFSNDDFFKNYQRAGVLFLNGEYQKSVDKLHEIEQETPNLNENSYIFYLIAKNYQALKNYSLALFYFKEYIRYNPNTLDVYIDMAIMHLENQNRKKAYNVILIYLREIKNKQDVHPKIWNLLSYFYLTQNNLRLAQKYINIANNTLKNNPKHLIDKNETLFLESRLHLNLGNFTKSEKSLQTLLQNANNSLFITNYAGYFYEQYAKFLYYSRKPMEEIYPYLIRSRSYYIKAQKQAQKTNKKEELSPVLKIIQKNFSRLQNVQ